MLCTNPFSLRAGYTPSGVERFINVPCGKCLACRINKRREWTQRLLNESYSASSSYFITLTYSDEYLPRDDNDNPCVSKRDVQLFMKRLRKTYGNGIRYFIGSEYGPETLRPHYHGIIYNLPDIFLNPSTKWTPGMSLISRDPETGFTSMINRRLNDIWQYGTTTIGSMSRERASYCAKYFVDKKNVDEILVPVFNVMSRRPGIGKEYSDAIAEKVRYYKQHSMLADNGKYIALPRYYDKKIFSEDERKQRFAEYMAEIDRTPFDDSLLVIYDNSKLVEENQKRAMTFKGTKSKL